MPSMMSSIVQGFKNYASIVKFQASNNTVAMAVESAEFKGTSRPKAAARAIGGGMATFLAPPVVIGNQAVKDYREKRFAEQQKSKLDTLVGCLMSHGISQFGAVEMAHQVILKCSAGYYVSDPDYKLWLIVASIKEKHLAQYTPRITDRLESNKSKLTLA